MLAHLLLALALAGPAPTGPDPAPAGGSFSGRDGQLQVTIPRVDAHVTVDGTLDEEVWSTAARLVDFSEYAPVDGAPADQPTEVLVWYSPTAIYFGIRAHAAPGTVHATLANRDHIDADDSVLIFLNTYNDGRQALVFGVNPFGVQADGVLVEGSGKKSGTFFSALESGREEPDLTPDYVFTSKGRLRDDGYDIEVEIPFKSLRFPSTSVQDWGINVVQKVQSVGHEHSWTPARRATNSFLAQVGTLKGLHELNRGLVLDLNPVLTAKAVGAPVADNWSYDASRPEFGANVRWGITPNLTLSGTLNPDFSQVEADASQFVIDPRRALFFAEKRPFFLEGAELFAAPNQLIYTRRIISPLSAVKVTGQAAGTDIAVLSAVDDASVSASGGDHPVYNIARLQHSLQGQSKIGLVYTDRVEGTNFNRVAAADTRLAFRGIYTWVAQAGLSSTRTGGETKTAPLWHSVLSRDGKHFGFQYTFTGIHEDFAASSGFISRGANIHANLTHRATWLGAADDLLQRWSSSVAVDGIWQYKNVVRGDRLQEQKLHFNNSYKLKGGWSGNASVLIEQFAYDPTLYDGYGLLTGSGSSAKVVPYPAAQALPNLDWVLAINTPQFAKFTSTLSYLWGKDENFFEWSSADIGFLDWTLDWRPTDQLRVSPEYHLQFYRRQTDGSMVGRRQLPRLKVEYQLSRSIFFRLVGQYDSRYNDALRDDSRTGLPIVVQDATGAWVRAGRSETNTVRLDWLFSYQPTPGTVVFAGYGSSLAEPETLKFNSLRRTADGFFVKVSYLFRM